MNEIIAEHLNDWSVDSWLDKKRKLSDAVWFECALLAHHDTTKIYAAPSPTIFGVVYEIRLSDLVEVVGTGRTLTALDKSYKITRIYLKKESVILRLQWMIAAEIPTEVLRHSTIGPALSSAAASGSLLDLASSQAWSEASLNMLGDQGPKPTPTPTPSTSPSPTPSGGGGGGGRGVTGVRG